MLARHAESLFWAGRYIERAESTARMLDVAYHTHLELMSVHESAAWFDLLKVLNLDMAFSETEQPLRADTVTSFLVLDPENPGTIRSNPTSSTPWSERRARRSPGWPTRPCRATRDGTSSTWAG